MTHEDKELLLKDLCTRLPYGVKVKVLNEDILSQDSEEGVLVGKENAYDDCFVVQCSSDSYVLSYIDFIPYLTPMSSMTDYEKIEWHKITLGQRWITETNIEWCIDWLNSHHFDYRGLIEKGLALEAPAGMYENITIIAKNY